MNTIMGAVISMKLRLVDERLLLKLSFQVIDNHLELRFQLLLFGTFTRFWRLSLLRLIFRFLFGFEVLGVEPTKHKFIILFLAHIYIAFNFIIQSLCLRSCDYTSVTQFNLLSCRHQNLILFLRQFRCEGIRNHIIIVRIKQKQVNLYKLFSTITQSQHRTNMGDQLRVTSKQMGINSNNIDNLVIEDMSLKNFPAKPLEGYFLAHIYWSIFYKFVPRVLPVKEGYPMVIAQPEISPKSWMNRKCADNCLIQHEYGHYLIACWCALEFQETVNYGYQSSFIGTTIEQYKEWCTNVFKSTLKKYCAIQRKYDEETEHYCDQEKQAEWEKKIASSINEYDRKSKQRAKQKRQNQPKQTKKFENRRAFSQHNSKKQVNQVNLKPVIPASGYRIRPTGLPIRPVKVA